jgi:hypothetical protein
MSSPNAPNYPGGEAPPEYGRDYGREYQPPYYAPPPPSHGQAFSFDRLFQGWVNVLRNPRVAAFDMEQPGANWTAVWIGVLIMALVEAVAALFTRAAIAALGVSGTARDVIRTLYPGADIGNQVGEGPFEAFVSSVVMFFLGAGLIYLVARILGGRGTFLGQTYLMSLAIVPLSIISAAVGWIPVFGGIISFVAGIYLIVLVVMAVMSAHRLNAGLAIISLILPVVAVVAIIVALAVIVALIIALIMALTSGAVQ